MDWDNIRFFLSVARARQFLAAARQLGVDHGTVSRRIGALESSLGVRLFDRQTTGCTLTAAGERLYESAEDVEAQLLRAQGDLSQSDVELSGTVRLAAPDGFTALFLCPRLGKLKASYPSLTIQLVPISRTFSLSKREADLAITIARPEQGRLAARKLVDYSLHFYAAKDYLAANGTPQTTADLTRHRLVTYVQDLVFADQLNFMPELYGPTYSRLECSSAVGQLMAVRNGAGIGILHDYAAHTHPQLHMVLPDIVFERSYWMMTHIDLQRLNRVRAISDFIIEEVSAQRSIFRP
ncbi:LysR family transcriptional regulator [Nitrobacter sp. JJSN]|jgi:DNA-binding transcriptional LysR family regulator|uniref:LysR family transcriptional regulator n=1 Tax=Nitrobacter sp. JJSN TaxID=3453033 RepID=UPI003F76A051